MSTTSEQGEGRGGQSLQDKVWARVTEGHLRCDVRVSLVTSGYTDRYVAYEPRYELNLEESGFPAYNARVYWHTQDEAIGALIFLTGRGITEVVSAVLDVKASHYSSWESEDGTRSSTGPVRAHVIDAIGKLATAQAREAAGFAPGFTVEALADFYTFMRSATPAELECARWHLAECNRTNAKSGRDQVAFPTLPEAEVRS